MACVLNPAFWVYIIVLIGGIMLIRLLVPWFVAFFGFLACAGIYFLSCLLSCLFSSGSGLSFPTFPHTR